MCSRLLRLSSVSRLSVNLLRTDGMVPCVGLLMAALTGPVWALEDPTRPPSAGDTPTVQTLNRGLPRLKSILRGPERSVALIDRWVLSEGERAGELEVLRISETSVTVRVAGGERMTLLLPGSQIHKEFK